MRKEDQNKAKQWPFILSVIIHLCLLVIVLFFEKETIKNTAEKMEIEWVEIQDLQKATPLKEQQVVQQEERLNDIKPTEDYKLSQFDQKIKEEMRAAKTGKFKNALNQNLGNKKSQQQGQQKQKAQSLSLDDLKPTMVDSSFKASAIQPGAGGEVSQSNDYLKNVKLGAQTLLSTREFVYYSYYNRIKNKLSQHWEPIIKKKIVRILKRGRRIASTSDKITRLVITLDKEGQLMRVTLRGASGYNDLDDAAVEAFKAAAPFPNPPSGIVDKKGEIKINWDFVLET